MTSVNFWVTNKQKKINKYKNTNNDSKFQLKLLTSGSSCLELTGSLVHFDRLACKMQWLIGKGNSVVSGYACIFPVVLMMYKRYFELKKDS